MEEFLFLNDTYVRVGGEGKNRKWYHVFPTQRIEVQSERLKAILDQAFMETYKST